MQDQPQAFELDQQESALVVSQDDPTPASKSNAADVLLDTSGIAVDGIAYADGAGRTAAAVNGMALGAGIAIAISFAFSEDTVLGRMFSHRRFESLIPAIILCVSLWGCFICILRYRRLKVVRAICAREWADQIVSKLRNMGSASTAAALTGDVVAASPMLRRIKAVLDQWQVRRDLQDVDVILQQHVERDEEELHNSYSLVRMFVWALPVLGLIGTVIGISLAVGGFSQFLGGSIDDVAEIKKNLISVTGGLSFAFLITLEGLAGSLILMFSASSLQNGESRILINFQKQITDLVLPALQEKEPVVDLAASASTAAVHAVNQSHELLVTSSQSILGIVQEAASQLLQGIRTNLESQQRNVTDISQHMDASAKALITAVESATTRISQAHEQFDTDTSTLKDVISGQREIFDVMLSSHKETVEAAQNELVSVLSKQTEIAAQNAQAIGQLVAATQSAMDSHRSAQREVFHEMLSSHKAAVDNAQAELTSALNRQTQVIAEHAQALTQLVSATQTVTESQKTSLAKLDAIDLTSPVNAMAQLSSQLNDQTRHLAVLAQTFEAMLRGTDTMISSHNALQASTKQLHEVGLGQTLASVRDSLTALTPTLESLRKPFVWRAIPVDGEAQT